MGMGDKVDTASGTALTPGGYAMVARTVHHWATATVPFVIQVQASGPFDQLVGRSHEDCQEVALSMSIGR